MKFIDRSNPGYFKIPQKDNIYYVYGYFDEGELFYIGKGKHSRYRRHLFETVKTTRNPHKFHKIQEIRRKGKEPLIQKIAKNLSELKAYEIERFIIDSIGTTKKGTGPLLNLVTECGFRFYDKDKYKTSFQKIGEGVKKAWKNPHSGYYGKKFQAHIKSYGGSGNPRYEDHRSYISLHGEEKAQKLKEEQSIKTIGAGNPCAKKWKLISPDGKAYFSKGNLKKKCYELGIHFFTLRKHIGIKVKYGISKGWTLYEI